jgi:hypothetical protein
VCFRLIIIFLFCLINVHCLDFTCISYCIVPWCVLLVLFGIPLLCYVVVCQHLNLVCSFGAHCALLWFTNGEHSIYVLCCYPSTFLWCVLLVFVSTIIMSCWCSLAFPCYALSILINIPLLGSVGVCHHPFVALYCCLLSLPWCILLVFINTLLLHYVGAHHYPLVVLCWCLLTHLCCVLLVLIGTCLLCFIGMVGTPIIMFCWFSSTPPCYCWCLGTSLTLNVHQHSFDMFYCCS